MLNTKKQCCVQAELAPGSKNYESKQLATDPKVHFIGRKALKLITNLNFLNNHYRTSLWIPTLES